MLDYAISLPYSSFVVPSGGTLVLMQHQNSISKCAFAVSSYFSIRILGLQPTCCRICRIIINALQMEKVCLCIYMHDE